MLDATLSASAMLVIVYRGSGNEGVEISEFSMNVDEGTLKAPDVLGMQCLERVQAMYAIHLRCTVSSECAVLAPSNTCHHRDRRG